jgi:hypothetical protein
MFGPTYELRNKRFAMDAPMRNLLYDYWLRDQVAFLEAFFEGLAAGRIWEL